MGRQKQAAEHRTRVISAAAFWQLSPQMHCACNTETGPFFLCVGRRTIQGRLELWVRSASLCRRYFDLMLESFFAKMLEQLSGTEVSAREVHTRSTRASSRVTGRAAPPTLTPNL